MVAKRKICIKRGRGMGKKLKTALSIALPIAGVAAAAYAGHKVGKARTGAKAQKHAAQAAHDSITDRIYHGRGLTLPQEAQFGNQGRRCGQVHDPPVVLNNPRLAAAIAMTQGNSPLDPENTEHRQDYRKHHKRLIENAKGGGKLRALYKARTLTKKGGFVSTKVRYTALKPESDVPL